jgi:hypothetical protein
MKSKQENAVVEVQSSETKFAMRMSALASLAHENPRELEKRKFGPDKLRDMDAALTDYNADHAAWLAEKGRARQLAAEVRSGLAEVSELRVEINGVLVVLGKEGTVSGSPLRGQAKLSTSAVVCLRWMSHSRPTLVAIEPQLASCMERPLPRFDAAHATLATAVAAEQQCRGKSLPAKREALADSRAELKALGELLASAARVAFKGKPALLKRLKAALQLGHRTKKKAAPPPVGKDVAA